MSETSHSQPVANIGVFDETKAAKILKLSRVSLWRLRRAGKIGYCKVGTRVLYRQEHLANFLDQQERSS